VRLYMRSAKDPISVVELNLARMEVMTKAKMSLIMSATITAQFFAGSAFALTCSQATAKCVARITQVSSQCRDAGKLTLSQCAPYYCANRCSNGYFHDANGNPVEKLDTK
jgi:hypothetical protein